MLNRLRDVFASFQKHDVRYVVIGGIAAVLHGVPRATFDIDLPSSQSELQLGRDILNCVKGTNLNNLNSERNLALGIGA